MIIFSTKIIKNKTFFYEENLIQHHSEKSSVRQKIIWINCLSKLTFGIWFPPFLPAFRPFCPWRIKASFEWGTKQKIKNRNTRWNRTDKYIEIYRSVVYTFSAFPYANLFVCLLFLVSLPFLFLYLIFFMFSPIHKYLISYTLSLLFENKYHLYFHW